jgi:hypothetical protein
MATLKQRLTRLEDLIGEIGAGECPLCRFAIVIWRNGTPEQVPDCFDETLHCRRCGREADGVNLVCPKLPGAS